MSSILDIPAEYELNQIETALSYLAMANGNPEKAVELISFGITPKQLRRWRDYEYRDRYKAITENLGREQENSLIMFARDNALDAAAVEKMAIKVSRSRLEDNLDEDPSRTAANMAKIKNQSIDQVLKLTGRPVDAPTGTDLLTLARALIGKGLMAEVGAINGTAEEDEDDDEGH